MKESTRSNVPLMRMLQLITFKSINFILQIIIYCTLQVTKFHSINHEASYLLQHDYAVQSLLLQIHK